MSIANRYSGVAMALRAFDVPRVVGRSLNRQILASIVVVHPGNSPFVQHAARGLQEAGLLKSYVTTFVYEPQSPLGRVVRGTLRLVMHDADLQLRRRCIDHILAERVIGHPLPEFLRMAISKGIGPVAGDLAWEVTEKWFSSVVARKHLAESRAVYSYEHVALDVFEAQKSRGGLCIYDMTTPHHASKIKWMAGEFERFPELQTRYERHRHDLAPRRNRRKDKELALGDRVVVPSRFTFDSIVAAGVDPQKIWLVPFGAPPVVVQNRAMRQDRFIFLVAGNLSVNKGVHYVIDAWRKLAPQRGAELWLVGTWKLPDAYRHDLPGKVWISPSVPRSELFAIFDRANVLLFPTLFEGLGQISLEAMARGLPVITTPNSGADMFIDDGVNGVLIQPADLESLTSAMSAAMDDPRAMEEMGRRAAETMARWQWSDYRLLLASKVAELLCGEPPVSVSQMRRLT
jgi:glycosyltransferase involved in cell wall biosynthesis